MKAWSSKKDLRTKCSGLVPSHHHPGDVTISVSSGMPRRQRVASLRTGHHPLPQLLFFFFWKGTKDLWCSLRNIQAMSWPPNIYSDLPVRNQSRQHMYYFKVHLQWLKFFRKCGSRMQYQQYIQCPLWGYTCWHRSPATTAENKETHRPETLVSPERDQVYFEQKVCFQ